MWFLGVYAPSSSWGCRNHLNVCIESICILLVLSFRIIGLYFFCLPLVSPEVLSKQSVHLDSVLSLHIWRPCKHCLATPASRLMGTTGVCHSGVQQLSLHTQGLTAPHIVRLHVWNLPTVLAQLCPLCFLMGLYLTPGFQESSSKSWLRRIICFHNFPRQSVLRNAMQINHPRYFKTMVLPQWRWSVLAFSVHIFLLFFHKYGEI